MCSQQETNKTKTTINLRCGTGRKTTTTTNQPALEIPGHDARKKKNSNENGGWQVSPSRQKSTFAACHVCKQKKQKNNQPVSWLACLCERVKQQSHCAWGKTTINLCSRLQTQKNTITINRCGLSRPQQEKNNKAKQQSSCAAASCHGPWPQAKTNTIIMCGGLSRPQARKTKQQSNCAASRDRKPKKEQSTFAACCIYKKKKKEQLTCESDGESSRENNNLTASGENQQSTCASGHKPKKNWCGLLWPHQEKPNKTKQQSSCVAASYHDPRPQARKSTIILCSGLARLQARKKQSNCAASCGRKQKEENNQPLWPVASARKRKKEQSTCESGGESLRVGKNDNIEQETTTINLCSRTQTHATKKTHTNNNNQQVRPVVATTRRKTNKQPNPNQHERH